MEVLAFVSIRSDLGIALGISLKWTDTVSSQAIKRNILSIASASFIYGCIWPQRYCLRPAGTASRPLVTAFCIYGHHIRFLGDDGCTRCSHINRKYFSGVKICWPHTVSQWLRRKSGEGAEFMTHFPLYPTFFAFAVRKLIPERMTFHCIYILPMLNRTKEMRDENRIGEPQY